MRSHDGLGSKVDMRSHDGLGSRVDMKSHDGLGSRVDVSSHDGLVLFWLGSTMYQVTASTSGSR